MKIFCGTKLDYGKKYKIENQYTPYSWINGKEKVTVKGTNNAYMYFIIEDNEMTEDYPIAVNKRIIDLIMGGCPYSTGNGGFPYYYLASVTEMSGISSDLGELVNFNLTFVTASNEMGVISPREIFFSVGGEYDTPIYAGVRPVITLKTNITNQDIQRINDIQETDNWPL